MLPVDFCFVSAGPWCAAIDLIREDWTQDQVHRDGGGSFGRRSGPGEGWPGTHQSEGSCWCEDPLCLCRGRGEGTVKG